MRKSTPNRNWRVLCALLCTYFQMATVDVVQHLVGCVVVAVVDVGGYVQFVALTAIVRCGLEKQINLIVTQLGQFGLTYCLCVSLYFYVSFCLCLVWPCVSLPLSLGPMPTSLSLLFVCLSAWLAVCLSFCICLCLPVCLSG